MAGPAGGASGWAAAVALVLDLESTVGALGGPHRADSTADAPICELLHVCSSSVLPLQDDSEDYLLSFRKN